MDDTTKKILEIVTDMQENMATKSDIARLEKGQQEIRDIITPLAKAVDKDAETIIKHDARIARIEKRVDAVAQSTSN